MTVRAKYTVRAKEHYYEPADGGSVKLNVVSSGSEENKQFFKWTPSGEIQLMTINKAAFDYFELGKQYYVDFTLAPEPEKTGT